MDAVEKVGKSYVATEKALDGISKQSEATFQEAVEKQSPVDTDKEIKFVDVTHKLFEKPVIDEFPQSSVCIYKGIISNLISWGREGQGDKICGIMSGDGKSVLDVVICTDFQLCITSDRLSKRLSNLSLQPMGLVVWAKDFDIQLHDFAQSMQDLKSPYDTQVLLVMCGGHDPRVWDTHIQEDGDVKFTRCNGVKFQTGRKKEEKYRVVDFSALSKNTVDNMHDAVSAVLQDVLKEALSKKLKPFDIHEACDLQEHCVPADGLCFWHSVLGSLDFDVWKTVPRKNSGYSTNQRIVKTEEDRARKFMKTTMERVRDRDLETSRCDEILATGCVDVMDIDFIAKALGIGVRCTISDEAELGEVEVRGCSKILFLCIYIYTYSYLYVYIYACSSTIFRIYIYICLFVWENTNSHI